MIDQADRRTTNLICIICHNSLYFLCGVFFSSSFLHQQSQAKVRKSRQRRLQNDTPFESFISFYGKWFICKMGRIYAILGACGLEWQKRQWTKWSIGIYWPNHTGSRNMYFFFTACSQRSFGMENTETEFQKKEGEQRENIRWHLSVVQSRGTPLRQ